MSFPLFPVNELGYKLLLALERADIAPGSCLPVRHLWRKPFVSIFDNQNLLVTLFHAFQEDPIG